VGRVVRPHGLAGEVVVELWTDRVERLDPGTSLASDAGDLRVQASRAQPGRSHGRYVVRFEDVDDVRRAEALRGVELRAAPLNIGGVLWLHELVGAQVVTVGGRDLGTVVALEPNPASDLLVLAGGALIPLRFVTSVDPGAKVTVDIPDGLVD
jgi:16S rRNA processing protein RimM